MIDYQQCPSEEMLAAYMERRLTKQERAAVTEHLASCAVCYRVFTGVARDEAEQRRAASRRFPHLLAAAIIAIAVLTAGWYFIIRDRTVTMENQVSGNESLEREGSVSVASGPFLARAETVFQKLLKVVEQTQTAELVWTRANRPYAVTSQDNKIIISEGALQLCYTGVTVEEGDARMAFVLGHELSHLKSRNFSHHAAFAAMEKSPPAPAINWDHELSADSSGLIYASIAGYPTEAVIRGNNNFIRQWIARLSPATRSSDGNHPDAETRAQNLRLHLKQIANEVEYFHFGVRLYQLGRYEDALLLLQHFADQFPSREVSNNLGLTKFQMSMQWLATCDAGLVRNFYLSTILDPQTIAERFRSAGSGPCLKNNRFQQLLTGSQDSFRRAIDLDPSYFPARINLSSTHIVLQQYHDALKSLEEVLSGDPDNSAALNNKAIALYLLDAKNINTSLSILKQLSISNYTPAYYNLATLQEKEGAGQDAVQSYSKFLEKEPRGLYAGFAQAKAGIKADNDAPLLKTSPPWPPGQPVPKEFSRWNTHEFELHDVKGTFYTDGTNRVLSLDGVIEIVETTPPSNLRIKNHPLRMIETPTGKVEVYRNFAIELRDGRNHRIVYF